MRNLRRQSHHSHRNNLVVGALGVISAGLLYRAVARRTPAAGRLPLTGSRPGAVHLQGSVNIDRSAETLYRFWRSFVELPQVMTFLDRVEERERGLTHWVVHSPLGATIEWDSEVTEDIPGQRIAWRSLEGADIHSWGSVEFYEDQLGRSTDVTLNLHFEPPGRAAGGAVARFLSGLEKAVLNQNLRNLKAYMETGEVPTAGDSLRRGL